MTSHFKAIESGNVRLFIDALGRVPDVDAPDPASDAQRAPLHCAASEGDLFMVRALLRAKARPDVFDAQGRTPLHVAAAKGFGSVCGLLLRSKAGVNARSAAGRTPLHRAVVGRHGDVLEVLLAHKAAVHAYDNTNHHAAPLHLAAEAGRARNVQTLLAHGADPEITTAVNHETALSIAALRGHTAVVVVLAAAKADVEQRSCVDDVAPLHRAAKANAVDTVEALAACKAALNSKDADEWTPLHVAVYFDNYEAAAALLALKADAHAREADNWTPLHLAARRGHAALAHLLVVEGGASLNTASEAGNTPLHTAAHAGHADVVEALLGLKADPLVLTHHNRTALQQAVAVIESDDCVAALRHRCPVGRAALACTPSSAFSSSLLFHTVRVALPPPLETAGAAALPSTTEVRLPLVPCCPITQLPLEDPVACPEGFTFERRAIERWLHTNLTNPLTRTFLQPSMLAPNRVLKETLRHIQTLQVRAAPPVHAAPPRDCVRRKQLPRAEFGTPVD